MGGRERKGKKNELSSSGSWSLWKNPARTKQKTLNEQQSDRGKKPKRTGGSGLTIKFPVRGNVKITGGKGVWALKNPTKPNVETL